MQNNRFVMLDTETTGLDPISGHRITEIGCVEYIYREKTGNNFHSYINPKREVSPEAFRITGISTAFLKDKPEFKVVARDLVDYLEGATLVIHNAPFDLKFLNFEFALLGIKPISPAIVLDTLVIARKKFPGAPASLDALCRRFKIDASRRDKHGALLDAELLGEIYLHLICGEQNAIDFRRESALNFMSEENITIRPSRNFKNTETELQAHLEYTKVMKKSIWYSEA